MPNIIIGKESAFSKGFFFTDEATSSSIDLTNASYSGTKLDIGGEIGRSTGLEFNDDGSKLYVVDSNGANVHEYDLDTSFDLATASYSGTSFDASFGTALNSTGGARGITFNNNGTKLFMAGNNTETIYRYGFDTGFDISAINGATSFDVSSETANLHDVGFNGDGSKMFVLGGSNDSIFEYDLATGFDLSTASFSGANSDVDDLNGTPTGFSFNGDGTEMLVKSFGAVIYKYNLSTGFDLSSASFSGDSFDAGSTGTSSFDLSFNTDGSKMFFVNRNTTEVLEYTL